MDFSNLYSIVPQGFPKCSSGSGGMEDMGEGFPTSHSSEHSTFKFFLVIPISQGSPRTLLVNKVRFSIIAARKTAYHGETVEIL